MKKFFTVLFLFTSLAAYSRVIYRDTSFTIVNTGPISSQYSHGIDFNKDGIIDIRFDLHYYSTYTTYTNFCLGSNTQDVWIDQNTIVYGLNQNRISDVPFTPVPPNTLITATSHMWTTNESVIGISTHWYTHSPSNINCPPHYVSHNYQLGSGYLGVKLLINGQTHYGYIYFLNNMVKGFAYETIPFYPITTGDKKGYFGSEDPNHHTISGILFNDANSNCIKDAGEAGIPHVPVYITNGDFYTYTDSSGNYQLLVDGGTNNYTVTIDTQEVRLISNCYPQKTISVPTSGNNQTYVRNIAGISCNNLNISISINSNRRRRCFRNSTYVRYANSGSQSVANTTVKVIMPSQVKAISSTPSWNQKNGDTLVYNLGTLSALSLGTIMIIDSVICGDESIRGKYVCTKALISPTGYCSVDWDQSDMTLNGSCQGDLFSVNLKNSGTGDMTDSLSYRIFLDTFLVQETKFKLNSNDNLSFNILAEGKTVRVETEQHDYHPVLKSRAIFYEGCGNGIVSDSMINYFENLPSQIGEAVSCMQILDSYDPNDKSAVPESNYIEDDQELTYTIRFQNTGTDTAYTVVIADTLDANLDPASIRITGASHNYKFEMTGKNNPRLVWIFGGIMLPDSTTNKEKSQGFVSFKVRLKEGLSAGTFISNEAHIFFDYNSAIITNKVNKIIGSPYTDSRLHVSSFSAPDSICVGSPVLFNLSATGFNLKYNWKKNGFIIPGETGSQYSIATADSAHTGEYILDIQTPVDTLELKKDLFVKLLPEFLTVPDDENICDGVEFKTGVKAKGTNLNYQWYKDNSILIDENHDSLGFSSFSPANTGAYKVTITNSCNSLTSGNINLFVLEKPELSSVATGQLCHNGNVDLLSLYEDLTNTLGTSSYYQNNLNGSPVSPIVNTADTYYIIKTTTEGCSDTITVNVVNGICTGTSGIMTSNIKLFPNPAQDVLHIEDSLNSSVTLEIFDTRGKLIKSESFHKQKQIDVSELPPGRYTLKLITGDNSTYIPLIKN